MTTVTIGDPEKFEAARVKAGMTPSAQAVAKADATFEVTDSRGRVLTLKKPNILAQYRLIEALGETAKNEVYLGMTLPFTYLVSIQDANGATPVSLPTNKMQLEALIQRLGDAGVTAIAQGINEHFSPKSPEEEKEAVKK